MWYLVDKIVDRIVPFVIIMLISLAILGSILTSPKFKVGDCISKSRYVEPWEARGAELFKVLEVGHKSYRLFADWTHRSDDILLFDDEKYYALSKDCPFDMDHSE